jgi:hypothetical protein
MSTADDRRDARRVILAPPSEARFVLRGHAFQEVRVTNISMGGCFLMVGKRDERLFQKEALLESLTVAHPELPQEPITGQVVYTLGVGGPGMDYVGVGVRFVAIPSPALDGLQAFVVQHLGPLLG